MFSVPSATQPAKTIIPNARTFIAQGQSEFEGTQAADTEKGSAIKTVESP